MDNLVFGVAVTLYFALAYGLKRRLYRKWLGIVLVVVGLVGSFAVMPLASGFDPFNVFLVMWLTGLTLFFERDRYSGVG
ncbi:hypothetical protein [Pseudomonas ovata]|uniref:hypothetical protein n=1 Tax=Pseudomonas ovata TaxID=1839709 RepID=UPI000D695CFA|nr:hypothetical protein [Pseudomonas ovata]